MYTSGGTASSHPIRDYNGPTENYYSELVSMMQLRYCTTLQYIDKAGVNSRSERAPAGGPSGYAARLLHAGDAQMVRGFAYELPVGYPDGYDYSTLKSVPSGLAGYELIDAECKRPPSSRTNCRGGSTIRPDGSAYDQGAGLASSRRLDSFAASPVIREDYSADQKLSHWKTAFEVNQQAVTASSRNV